ncbi:MAG: ZIP family metal transporter [Chloroflexia bacterium]|nr:ZIP family metal transporter [Chloroflexia bacterium]
MKLYILYALLSATIVSLVAFIGILFLAFKTEKLQKIVFILVSFAVGSLFGSAFFVLIPESYHLMPDSFVPGLMIVAGVLTMFILEKFIHWRHGHNVQYIPKEASLGYVSLMTDSLHNFVDGVLIASAWAVSPEVGMVTTLSVIIHEAPQEISDFGILIYAGFSKKRALLFNFLAAVTALLGVLFTAWLGHYFENITNYILPMAAGGFIYLAGSDLIPQLHKEKSTKKNLIQFVAIVAGFAMMFVISQMQSHSMIMSIARSWPYP